MDLHQIFRRVYNYIKFTDHLSPGNFKNLDHPFIHPQSAPPKIPLFPLIKNM